MDTPDHTPVLVHCEQLTHHSFGPGHPMGPDRVALALDVADAFGLLDGMRRLEPEPVPRSLLLQVHTAAYLDGLRDGREHPEMGLAGPDCPVVEGLPEVAELVAAATTQAAREVWEGRALRAVNPSGGLHHAMADRAAGFCLLNDAAVAIAWLLENGAHRVAYLDLDAHHGDGVERAFWDDPRVLTLSWHESGRTPFPGTGYPGEVGGPHAQGTAVNVALMPDVTDEQWLRALTSIAPPLLKAFRPEILITQHGADPHRSDPLTHISLSLDAMVTGMRMCRGWADRYCGGRWVAVGGGGYSRDAVGRGWAHLVATVAGTHLAADTPMPRWWPDRVGPGASTRMGDDDVSAAVAAHDPSRVYPDQPDAPIVQTSRAVFPWWGINPYH